MAHSRHAINDRYYYKYYGKTFRDHLIQPSHLADENTGDQLRERILYPRFILLYNSLPRFKLLFSDVAYTKIPKINVAVQTITYDKNWDVFR